jgi:HSP90 family molecular chaperone
MIFKIKLILLEDGAAEEDFKITIETDSNKRQIIISDNGIGFTR